MNRWVFGYSFGPVEQKRQSPPLLRTKPLAIGDDHILSFQDIIQLLFIKLFRDEKISMPVIRAASDRAALKWQSDHPFAIRRLRHDGKTIFAELSLKDFEDGRDPEVSRDRILEDLQQGQIVISSIAKPYLFSKLDYNPDDVACWWPLGKEKRIVIDPRRNFGKPIDNKSGVSTYSLYAMVRGGEEPEKVARWYEVDEQAVEDAIEFEHYLKAA